MSTYEKIRELYETCPELSFSSDFEEYARTGHAHITPSYALLARHVGDGWFIRLAVGVGFETFWSLMPYRLPYIGWARAARGRSAVVWHRTETVERITKYAKHELLVGSCESGGSVSPGRMSCELRCV